MLALRLIPSILDEPEDQDAQMHPSLNGVPGVSPGENSGIVFFHADHCIFGNFCLYNLSRATL